MSGMIFVYVESRFRRSEPAAKVYFVQATLLMDFFSHFAIRAHRIRSPTLGKLN